MINKHLEASRYINYPPFLQKPLLRINRLLLSKTLEPAQFNKDQISDLIDFSFSGVNFLNNLDLFKILFQSISFIRKKYQIEGEDVKRKVNEGLYLRHVLRSAVWTDRIYHQLKEEERGKIDYRVLIFATLLHDHIELIEKNSRQVNDRLEEELRQFLNDEKSRLVISLVRKLTPEKKENVDMSKSEAYLEIKRSDFFRIWNENDENERPYLTLIKAADVLANFEETIVDLENKKADEKMSIPLFWRIRVFDERLNQIGQEYPFLNNTINNLKDRLKKTFTHTHEPEPSCTR